jgi:hypothetical protein
MKVGQKAIVRWVSKLVAKDTRQAVRGQPAVKLEELDSEQLRHVGGGNGGGTQLPKVGGW